MKQQRASYYSADPKVFAKPVITRIPRTPIRVLQEGGGVEGPFTSRFLNLKGWTSSSTSWMGGLALFGLQWRSWRGHSSTECRGDFHDVMRFRDPVETTLRLQDDVIKPQTTFGPPMYFNSMAAFWELFCTSGLRDDPQPWTGEIIGNIASATH